LLKISNGLGVIDALLIINADIIEAAALLETMIDSSRDRQSRAALFEEQLELAPLETGQGQLPQTLELQIGEADVTG
jgi:hypothetical protein